MTYKIPFDPDGNLLHDVDYWYLGFDRNDIVWREPKPFRASLHIQDMHRSGHSVYYTWQDGFSGLKYPMMVSDMLDLLKTTNVIGGYAGVDWEFVKRGRAYGIKVRKVK